jgi:hypothetical protein
LEGSFEVRRASGCCLALVAHLSCGIEATTQVTNGLADLHASHEMTGYIDDISSVAAILLLVGAIATALFRRSFPSVTRFLSGVAFGTAAAITLLLVVFIVAVTTSASPRLARYDAFCIASALFTFLPAQFLWFRPVRQRVLAVAALACLSLVPTFLSIASLRSSADPFYFPHL